MGFLQKLITATLIIPMLLQGSLANIAVHDTQSDNAFVSDVSIDLILPAPQMGENNQTSQTSVYLPFISNRSEGGNWPMVAANPERTSWTASEVYGNFRVEWYRPIQAFIPQNVQIIADYGLLYIATARGLYALKAHNGETAWRFDTQLPVGNSPTVENGVVYFGGFDRKIHALDARTGNQLWEYAGAKAGFSTNPLVINDMVLMGNRDGSFYAVGANGSNKPGQLIWKYQTGGSINLSAAYKGGVVYFAANDNYAYALDVNTGGLVWKSQKLPGDGYNSYWPVIYMDKVIFTSAQAYRSGLDPGVRSLTDPNGQQISDYGPAQKFDLFFDKLSTGGLIGPEVQLADNAWANGNTIINGSRISEYLEANPNPDQHLHKPWRRAFIILNSSDGSEFTIDTDHDGYQETAPVAYWGTKSGNPYPPLVSPSNILYFNNIYSVVAGIYGIPQGKVMGWKFGTQYLSVIGGQGATDEPQSISAGGNLIYRNICCDRVGDYFDIRKNGISAKHLWAYNDKLTTQAPGYNQNWLTGNSSYPGLVGNYGTQNGIYHNHGNQNPIIPYGGRLYVHRSNAIIAYGPGLTTVKLPQLDIQAKQDSMQSPTTSELKSRLEGEISKILQAGYFRPGYFNGGQFSQLPQLTNYFENPGDTLYTLAIAYPYLSPTTQQATRNYLQGFFQKYFDTDMYARIGWLEGAPREALPLPPEVEAALSKFPDSKYVGIRWSWQYPQNNIYAMWKYAQIFPADVQTIYALAKGVLQVPVSATATNEYFKQWPWEHNGYIAGYYGFLRLQELAGKTGADSQLRTAVTNELNRLLVLRANGFSKDTYWLIPTNDPVDMGIIPNRTMNVSRNFYLLVPELGDYLRQNALQKVQAAVSEYNDTGPYWFVARYDAVINEGVMQNLYDYSSMFRAKAYILKEPQAELTKYLDVPAFERGDLFFIQNLVAAIEAGN